MDNPTILPEEFVQFVLERLRTNPSDDAELDKHLTPQHQMCPLCMLNFTVYSLLEENSEDSVYFFQKAGLLNEIDLSLKKNVHGGSKSSRTKRYFHYN